MNSDFKIFIKGITSGYTFMIFSLIVGLWMVPFTLKYLAKPEYAVYAIATDLLGWLSLANLGLTSTFNSKAGQFLGAKNYDELNRYFNTAFFSQFFSSFLILFLGLSVIIFPDYFLDPTNEVAGFKYVVFILILNYAISYSLQPLSLLLVANKQIHIDNYLKFGLLFIKTVLLIIFLTQGFKLLSVALSNIISTLIISIITYVRVRKTFPDLFLKISLWSKDIFKFLISNGFWFSIGGIAGLLIFRMDSYLIGKYISLATVANFVITIKLYQIADTFHQQFLNTTRPYFAQTYGENNMQKLKKMYNLIYYLGFLSAFVLFLSVFFINKWFIGWWVGNEFYLGDTFNILLCVNFIIQAMVLPNRILLATSLYKIKQHNITRILEGITKYGFVLIFIVCFDINAVIIASIVASIIFSNVCLNFLSGKFLNDNYLQKIGLIILPLILLIQLKVSLYLFFVILLGILGFVVYISSKYTSNLSELVKPFYDKLFQRKSKKSNF